MARTTLDLDEAVLRQLKARRARENKPLGVIASELLARALVDEPQAPGELVWVSQPMRAKVDLDDRDALWAVLDAD
ncbi:MAG: antitoxin [Acidimicrobiales bacterium]|nr:antitoxin [Acidimicrobiales bacterium]